ncbi:hypothetical protein [Tardiphaga sp.]|uniref:hypothetical protein n=1 Tax=Tardiphaga sp. TaxID=1926292 RepID=UPI00262DA978|nr:hypothetical protein [Tardiphaga sp.]MDB5616179.1 hypothetical protein [Tardiphaga sp.]
MSAIGGLLLSAVTMLVICLVTFGFLLTTTNNLLNDRNRKSIRNRIEAFWFRTANLEVHEQFQAALISRYFLMRRLQSFFIKGFAYILIVLCVAGFIKGYQRDATEIATEIKELVKYSFDRGAKYQYSYDDLKRDADKDDPPQFTIEQNTCVLGEGFEPLKEISRLVTINSRVTTLLEGLERKERTLKLLNGFSETLSNFVFGLPLLLGLYISLNCTLWLLSRVTQSRAGAVLIVLFDLVLATAMPGLITGGVLCAMALVAVLTLGNMPDYTFYEQPTWITMLASGVSARLELSLAVPIIISIFITSIPIMQIGVWFLSTVATFILNNMTRLIADLGRIINFDLNIGSHETLLNYAIGIDLIFSLIYILPCLAIVLVQRSDLTRTLFLNSVQWVAEHPRGPLIAIEEIVMAFARYLASVFKR